MIIMILAHSITFSLYGGFVYQFMNPSSAYIGWIENYAILYAIINTVLLSMLVVAAVGLHIGKQKIPKSPEDLEVFSSLNKFSELKSNKTWYNLDSILHIGFAIFAFVTLSYYYLPLIMISGNLLARHIVSVATELGEKYENARR